MADKEKLSALMDGETIDKSFIQELVNDQEGLDAWKNYHLIGDVMRGEAPEKPEWNIAESVALALENEPGHNARYTQSANVVDDTPLPIEAQPKPTKARRQLPAWLSQFGQVAVAACVSLVVIVGVQQYGSSDQTVASQSSDDQIPVLQTIPLSGKAEPVSLVTHEANDDRGESNIQEQRRRVNAFLQDYELQLRLNSESGVASQPSK
ncbi:anti-sigma E factor [Vibrio sp. CAIM 722]|uniref:Anti-sigma-E factor RseA n=1 Tax=Vibrio eleionomae TaxID=2653505 RepID=A0A7X4LII5_9VIBR|nr:sigma-E factor negative regulatory protein [Vibrio eleionomae]MZI92501.1 anti-sigma E factor [Vibrio eleionomae]